MHAVHTVLEIVKARHCGHVLSVCLLLLLLGALALVALIHVSLLLLFGNQGQEVFLTTNEIIVSETLSIPCISRLMEIVHVQLADETRKVIMLEVSRKHVFSKLIGLIDYEACPRAVPLHSCLICSVL